MHRALENKVVYYLLLIQCLRHKTFLVQVAAERCFQASTATGLPVEAVVLLPHI